MKKLYWLGALLVAGAIMPAVADAGTGFTTFGSSTYVTPGNASNVAVSLIADGTGTPAVYSGIDFAVPSGLTIDNLNTLSTDYNFTASSCGVGSPRFGIALSGNPNATIFVYIGPPPSYTLCAPGWANTGNLLTSSSFVDSSQLSGGTFYDTWAAAQTRYTGQVVTDIFIVSDYGPTGTQTVQIDNTNVAGTVYTYETASACKNGVWQNFTAAPGPFKNQGDCVSYFATSK
jgi:hypothetical protein